MSPIITIHSSHRNIGKSFLTANLAVLLAEQGYRIGIIELDRVSDLPMLFGLDPIELAQRWTSLQQQPHEGSVADLWLPVGKGAIALLSTADDATNPVSGFRLVKKLQDQPHTNRLNQEITHLIPRLDADYILLETFPGFNEDAFLAFALADVLLLVLNPNAQDYQDTAVFADLAQRLQVPEIALVANQVAPDVSPEQLIASLFDTYQKPVLGTLDPIKPQDYSPYPHLFCQVQPDHLYTLELQAIAFQLVKLSQRAIASSA